MIICGIYQWRNLETGKVYVGSSNDCARRMSEHRSRLRRGTHINAKLQASWDKHGEQSFMFEIVATVLCRNWLEAVEQQIIDDRNAVNGGYNLSPTAGNTYGWRAGPETRKRMSDAAKRRDHSVQIEAMRVATTGRQRPKHVVDAMQAGRRANPLSKESKMKMSISAKARGSNITPEHQELLRQMSIAKGKFTDAHKREMSQMRSDGMSLREIGEKFGITAQSSVYANIKKWRAKQVAPI